MHGVPPQPPKFLAEVCNAMKFGLDTYINSLQTSILAEPAGQQGELTADSGISSNQQIARVITRMPQS